MTFRVLVVCDGNLCRSPLAERLLAARFSTAGVTDVDVSSAGVRGVVGAPMDPVAAAELARRGGSREGFTARRLDAAQIEAADLVLTATRDLRTKVLGESPRAMRRTFTLLEFAALAGHAPEGSREDLVTWAAAHRALAEGELDLVDPIGGTPDRHRAVAELIDEAVGGAVAALAATVRS
jgi:protein-tyrosine phosphatase